MNRQNSNVSFHLAGFTLIELVMVIVLIGILSAVAIINNPFNSIKLTNTVRKVTGDIRYVQKLAISNQTRCGLQITSATSYSIFTNDNPATLAKSAGDSCSDDGSGNFVVNFNASQCSNYNGIQISTTLPSNIVKFNSLGVPYGGDNNLLSSPQTITLSLSGANSVITIEPGTGRVYQ